MMEKRCPAVCMFFFDGGIAEFWRFEEMTSFAGVCYVHTWHAQKITSGGKSQAIFE
jgi:hypothetical protein